MGGGPADRCAVAVGDLIDRSTFFLAICICMAAAAWPIIIRATQTPYVDAAAADRVAPPSSPAKAGSSFPRVPATYCYCFSAARGSALQAFICNEQSKSH